MTLRSRSAAQTRDLGRRLGRAAAIGDVIALVGTFGAGKTTLVQGLAEGLGVREPVTSPSFALANEYAPAETGARVPLFHLDLYRVRDAAEAIDLDLADYMARGCVAIEWPESALELLPEDRLDLRLAPEGDERVVGLSAGGPRSRALLAAARTG